MTEERTEVKKKVRVVAAHDKGHFDRADHLPRKHFNEDGERVPGRNARFNEETMIKAIIAARGNKREAAKALRCTRSTISNYIRKYPAVARAFNDAKQGLIDVAERKLAEKVDQGFWPAIKFTLGTVGKDRGYTERTEITGAEGGPMELDLAFESALKRVYGGRKELEGGPDEGLGDLEDLEDLELEAVFLEPIVGSKGREGDRG